MKTTSILGLVLGCFLLACFGLHLRSVFSGDLQSQTGQAGPQGDALPEQGKRRTTERVDLGEGLELIRTVGSGSGEFGWRHEMIRRDGELMLNVFFHDIDGKGGRAYFHGGKQVLFEALDTDGQVEMLYLQAPDGRLTEAFERSKDGTTVPVSAARLAELRDNLGVFHEVFGPIVDDVRDGVISEQEMPGVVEESLETLEDRFSTDKEHGR